MKQLRVLARVLVVKDDKVLLVRNRGANFWYPPGGGWKYEKETITECASREVTEETGYTVDIKRLLWLQELHEGGKVLFETFWLAEVSEHNAQTIDGLCSHIDHDENGAVEEARWYAESELEDLKVFPERVKSFSSLVNNCDGDTDPFIGIRTGPAARERE